MTTEIKNASPTFIFWLFDWATHRIATSMRYYPRYIRCDIDEYGIHVYLFVEPIHILYSQIKSCEIYRFSQGLYAGPATNLKLELINIPKQDQHTPFDKQIYLVPVNPFHNEPGISEIESMEQIINLFRTSEVPTLPTNPYERELIREGKAAEFDAKKWNPVTPPNVYNPVPNPLLFLFKILLLTVIGTFIVLVVIGIIYNLIY